MSFWKNLVRINEAFFKRHVAVVSIFVILRSRVPLGLTVHLVDQLPCLFVAGLALVARILADIGVTSLAGQTAEL